MAPRSITTRISLEGSEEIRRALADLGKSTQDAFSRISEAAKSADLSHLEKSAAGAGEQMQAAKGSADQLANSLKNVSNAGEQASSKLDFSTIAKGAAVATTAVVGIVVAAKAAIVALANAGSETADKIKEAADKLNISPQALQALRSQVKDTGALDTALGKLVGNIDAANSSTEKWAGGLTIARTRIGEAVVEIVRGGGAVGELGKKFAAGIHEFDQLGFALKNAVGKEPIDQLFSIAEAIGKIRDPAKQAEAGVKFFGDEWKKFIDLAKQGSAVFKTGAEGARIFGDAEVAAGARLKKANDDLGESIKFTKDKIGLLFAEPQAARAEWLTKFIDGARNLVFEFIKADETKKKLLEAGKFNMFEDFDLDKFDAFLRDKGWETFADTLQSIRGFSLDLGKVWTDILVPAAKAVHAGFGLLASGINELFGTDVSARFLEIVTVIGLVTGAFGLLGAVLSPLTGAIGVVAAALGALLLLIPRGKALTGVWTEFSAGARAASVAVKGELGGLAAAFKAFARGDLSLAWQIFKASALKAFADIKQALSGSAFGEAFTGLAKTFAVITALAGGLALALNAVFGTDLGAGSVILLAALGSMLGVFRALIVAGQLLAFALTPIGAQILLIGSAAIILTRLFPDISKSWEQVTAAFGNLLRGDFSAALDNLKNAFSGFWANLKEQGVGTWAILGAAGVVAINAISASVVALQARLVVMSGLIAAVAVVAAALSDALGNVGKEGDVVNRLEDAKKRADEFANTPKKGLLDYFKQLFSVAEEQQKVGAGATDAGNKLRAAGEQAAAAGNAAAGGVKEVGAAAISAEGAADGFFERLKRAMGEAGAASSETAKKVQEEWKRVNFGGATILQRTAPQPKTETPEVSRTIDDTGEKIRAIVTQSGALPENFKKLELPLAGANRQLDQILESIRTINIETPKQPTPNRFAPPDQRAGLGQQFAALNTGTLSDAPPIGVSGQPNEAGTQTAALNTLKDALEGVATATSTLTTEQTAMTPVLSANTGEATVLSGALSGLSGVAQSALDPLLQSASALQGVWSQIGAAIQAAFDGLIGSAASAAEQTNAALSSIIATLEEVIARALEAAAALARANAAGGGSPANPPTGPGFASGGMFRGPGTGTSDSIWARVSAGEYIEPARVVQKPGVLNFLEALRRSGGDLRAAISRVQGFADGGMVGVPRFASGGAVGGGSSQVVFDHSKIASAVQRTVNEVLPKFVDAIEDLKNQAAMAMAKLIKSSIDATIGAASISQAGGTSLAFASGGHVRGPGSGRSDSILARVSNNEYIEPAHVVKRPGVLNFLETLRRTGGDLRAAIAGFSPEHLRGFSAGGIVDGLSNSLSSLMVPRFADGGLASLPALAPANGRKSGRNLTLVLDGKRFGGFTSSDDTMSALERHAIRQQLSSTGKKPGWVT